MYKASIVTKDGDGFRTLHTINSDKEMVMLSLTNKWIAAHNLTLKKVIPFGLGKHSLFVCVDLEDI